MVVGDEEEKKASKDIKGESSEEPILLGTGPQEERGSGVAPRILEILRRRDLQELGHKTFHLEHVLLAVPLEYPCGDGQ